VVVGHPVNRRAVFMTMMPAMMHSRAEMTAYTEILLNILPLHQRLKFILAPRFFVKLEAIG